jgi:hypothetical protein
MPGTACIFLALATGNDNMKYQGALMLQQEIRAAQKYYHIKNTNPVYFHNIPTCLKL